ncbi:GATA type transcriptional activator of nitrogen-regulated proteins [Coemansia sp. RSA 1972]|nr:GATA type transcriptional activator of nitrogen-regulated proteins [Coemansia sp. RSA 1972]
MSEASSNGQPIRLPPLSSLIRTAEEQQQKQQNFPHRTSPYKYHPYSHQRQVPVSNERPYRHEMPDPRHYYPRSPSNSSVQSISVERASRYLPLPLHRTPTPEVLRWQPPPQNSAERVSVHESRLMSAAQKAAAVKAASTGVAMMVKRIGRTPKRAISQHAPNGGMMTAAERAAAMTAVPGPAVKRGRVGSAEAGAEQTAKANSGVGPMTCVNCKTTKTPLWRRDPRGQPICNACGLYLKSYGRMRPMSLKRTQRQQDAATTAAPSASCGGHDEEKCPGNGMCNGMGGKPLCDGCPAYNQKHLPHSTRPIGVATPGGGVRRLTAAERAAAIANGAATDEHGNIVGPIPESAIGPGRIPPHVADAIRDAVAPADSAAQPASGQRAVCFNCNTDYTPLWRRDANGHITCNACGLYYKLHGRHRPISMKRDAIKRRRRGMPQGQKSSSPDTDNVDSRVTPGVVEPEAVAEPERVAELVRTAEPVGLEESPLLSPSAAAPPHWSAPSPDAAIPHAGAQLLSGSEDVERCREELQRECTRLQSLLERSTSLLESLNKAAPQN